MTDPETRQRIVLEVRLAFPRMFPEAQPHNACLYWALAVCSVCQAHGIRAILQGGSASWPRVRPEQDDGISPTHLSYVWEADSLVTTERLRNNLLPEMHVWAAILAELEVIDLTTVFWPQQCQRLLGRDWPGQKPPEWLWATRDELPDGVVYFPCRSAIAVMHGLLIGVGPFATSDVGVRHP